MAQTVRNPRRRRHPVSSDTTAHPVPAAGAGTRIRSLDGLRGVAAVVVVLHHSLLVSSAYADGYQTSTIAARGSGAWWILYTPLHLVWAGDAAVWIFFVLSGVVLSLAFLAPRRRATGDAGAGADNWNGYFPQRLARLYIPLWASLAFAAATFVLFERSAVSGGSSWLLAHPLTLKLADAAQDSTLYFVPPGHLNSVYWTLKWELVFSLLLPLFVVAARLSRRIAVVWPVGALLALMVFGTFVRNDLFVYLPIFGLGTVLASRADALRQFAAGLRPAHWWAIGVMAILLVESSWLVAGFATTMPDQVRYLMPAAAAGATLFVIIAWYCAPAVRLLEHRAVQWLGLRSYSLYLVHEPIVVGLGFALHGFTVMLLPLALAISLVVAAVFHRVVEVPSIRLSRRVGAAAIRLAREEPVPPQVPDLLDL